MDYFGIRDMEHLFDNIDDDDDDEDDDDEDDDKAAVFRSSFKDNYEDYEIRGDKDKKL